MSTPRDVIPRHTRGAVPLRSLYGINRSGTAMIAVGIGSVIDRRSTAQNCQHRGPSRWHGGNFEHVQNFRRPQCNRGLAQSAEGSPRHRHDRRGIALTAVAPPRPQRHRHERSSISITAFASAVQPPGNREKVDWRPYSDPVAVLLRTHV